MPDCKVGKLCTGDEFLRSNFALSAIMVKIMCSYAGVEKSVCSTVCKCVS